MRSSRRWLRWQPRLSVTLALSVPVILLNLVAYRQAYAMLNFTQTGEKTNSPEALSLWQKVKTLLLGVNIPKPMNEATPADWNLPFEIHRIKVNDLIQLEAWHIPHPQAKGLVILFHGYASSKSSLLPEAKALHELGYAMFLVDFRGSGGSNGHQTTLGFNEADDVLKTVEYTRSMLAQRPLILYGRSMGGAAVLRAIHIHHVQPDAIIVEAVFDKLLSTVQNRFAAMGVPAFPAAHLLIFWGGVQNGYFGFSHNPVEYAASVQCPALMLHGTDDPRATLAEGMAVFQWLNGEKHFEPFVGAGHEAYLAARPEQWKRTVTRFLAQI
ncbi:MAG: alpha/beta fold hydrolase [Chloroflexi bacterium]|nr:alpha/beta fold hydrolase [Chloroflexota bacterium]